MVLPRDLLFTPGRPLRLEALVEPRFAPAAPSGRCNGHGARPCDSNAAHCRQKAVGCKMAVRDSLPAPIIFRVRTSTAVPEPRSGSPSLQKAASATIIFVIFITKSRRLSKWEFNSSTQECSYALLPARVTTPVVARVRTRFGSSVPSNPGPSRTIPCAG